MDAADIDLPSAAEIAAGTGQSEKGVRDGWQRLHDAHALVLDGAGEIRMANPFAAQPTSFRVEAAGRSCGFDGTLEFEAGSHVFVDYFVNGDATALDPICSVLAG